MELTDGAYRTTDMTFATVLIMHGFNPIMEKINADKVAWVISADDWDERIEDLKHDYKCGACLVEPLRFMREIRDVRNRMYQILGQGDKPPGSRVQRASSV